MNREHHGENLHPAELLRRIREREAPAEAHSAPEAAAEMFARRNEELLRLRGRISGRLSEVLREKITYERDALLRMFEAHARAAEEERKESRVLDPNYFAETPLDIRHFLTI